MKNYYEILDVTRKTTPEDIKIAYRNLAKKYHPDNNKGNEEFEMKFKDLNEAYMTLSNPEEKRKYDRKSAKYKYGYEQGSIGDVTYEVQKTKSAFNDLVYNFFGLIKDNKKNAYTTLETAQSHNIPIKGENEETEIQITLEEAFFGGDKKIIIKGVDNDASTRNLTVNIPVGILDGHKIRLAGCGKAGKNGGKNGDLIITVRLLEHKDFRLDGTDLVKEINLTPSQAALGCNLQIATLDGEVEVKIPECAQIDKRIKIANKGFRSENGRGNLIILAKTNVPKKLTDKQRELYEKLRACE